jgi:O-antigen ligase
MGEAWSRTGPGLAAAATFALGVALPLLMAPASKSSPLVLCVAAVLSAAALWANGGGVGRLGDGLRLLTGTAAGRVALVLLALMAVSLLWSHDCAQATRRFAEFVAPLAAGAALLFAFPQVADRRRVLWWPLAAGAAACLAAGDILTGLAFRDLVGGRALSNAYNRPIVTLVVMAPAILALLAAHRRWPLAALLLPLPFAVWAGESATAVLGFAVAVAVLPVAWLMPGLTRRVGLALTIALIAVSPWIGTLADRTIGGSMHQAMASAHSDDRVAIWLSFEAAARARPILGSGFGSSLDMQRAPVAREVPQDRVVLLGSSHPHNAFLQLWVELGLVGALLTAALFVFWYRWIGRADPRLQPYLLAWTASVSAIALVSHGAWQAWWVAAIVAGAAGFLAVARDLRDDIVKPVGAA